ncbi:MAG: hypothetical protein ACU0CA_06010 [Paracoccaceae bacterium]
MAKTIKKFSSELGTDTLRRNDYFPTLVYSAILHDAESMNKEILAAINGERERDGKGLERSNFRSMGGWHSHNHLHKEKQFRRLTDRIEKMAAGINDDLGYRKGRKLEVTDHVVNRQPSGRHVEWCVLCASSGGRRKNRVYRSTDSSVI